jgi:hypothetical protein
VADRRGEEIREEEIESFGFFVLLVEQHDGGRRFGCLFFGGGKINFQVFGDVVIVR